MVSAQCLALALACTLSADAAVRLQPSDGVPFALTNMGLEIRIDYARRAVIGTATLHLRNISKRAASMVPLLLNRLMTVSGVTDARGATARFDQDVVVFEDDSIRQVNAVVVRLGRAVRPGETVAIVVRYGGILVGYTETGSRYIQDHVARGFTIIREDAFAFPVLGVPSWSANRSMLREPFAFSADVSVPADLVVAAGGKALPPTARDSLVTWHYRSDRPVPFLNIAIAPYKTTGQGGVRIFHFAQDSAGARMVEGAIRAAVGRYVDWYGPLSEEWRLTVIEIPEGWGSQASLTAGIIQTADAFRDQARLYQLYHELSHLWDAPDLDRPSARWNEGLASFLQWRMAAELDGWHHWDEQLKRLEQSLRRRCASGSPCATVPFIEFGKAGLTDLSYSVGAVMFYLLFQAMGAESFDRAYRGFLAQRRDTGATSKDLVDAFARADPLSRPIFSDWFTTTQWSARLTRGESVKEMLADYIRR